MQVRFLMNGVITHVWVVTRPAKRNTRRSIVREHPRHRGRQIHRQLRSVALSELAREWSPEIISLRLCLNYANTPHMRISAETIYQLVYRDAAHGQQLYRQLWRRRPYRRQRHDAFPHIVGLLIGWIAPSGLLSWISATVWVNRKVTWW